MVGADWSPSSRPRSSLAEPIHSNRKRGKSTFALIAARNPDKKTNSSHLGLTILVQITTKRL